jgi:hypothetical protein
MPANRTRLVLAALAFANITCFAAPSEAATITFGTSTQNISFTGNGANSVTVSTTGLTGNAFFDADPLGTYSFGATTFTAGPMSSHLYPAGANSESFTFTGGDGDTLSGTVHWNFIQDNTPQPKFFGTLTITSKAGDAAFLANFASNLAMIDFITNPLSSGGTLDLLTGTTGSATATISAGEVAPVPIPATLPLLAGGLAGLWALTRKRKDKRQGLSVQASA